MLLLLLSGRENTQVKQTLSHHKLQLQYDLFVPHPLYLRTAISKVQSLNASVTDQLLVVVVIVNVLHEQHRDLLFPSCAGFS